MPTTSVSPTPTPTPTPTSTPARSASPGHAAVLALMCACVAVVMSMVAAVNLAVPQMSAGSLHPSASQLLWVVDAYTVAFAGLLIPAGAFGDRHGRKGALMAGLAVFAAGCLLRAAAPALPVLIAGRLLAGAGAALVMPATMSVLLHVVPKQKRQAAVATWTASTAVAGLLGNIGGAAVVQYLPWQALFWVYVPLALALIAAVGAITPRTATSPANLDPVGSLLLLAGFVALLFGIIEGPALGWSSTGVLCGYGAAVVLLAIFIRYELRVEHPLLDPRLFRLPSLLSGTLGIVATFFGMFALFFVNAQFLQYVKAYSPLQSGVSALPLAVTMAVVSRLSPRAVRRLGARAATVTGMAVIACGLVLLSFADARTPYTLYALWLVLMGCGVGLAGPALSLSVVSALPSHRAGAGAGLNSASREMGAALGVAVVGSVLTSRFTGHLPPPLAGARSTADALTQAAHLSGTVHQQTVAAFAHAVADGYRTAAGIVLLVAILIAMLSGHRDEAP
ncbi:MFS transporter [Streptomyces sp. NPDC088560]|uniref:MFS transporter n=1 Tax=Streptomyces sp. NPDC088560 TaxID=3365868 RepID=UPI003811496C